MELPFLVVHGGWLWPVVGVVLVAATYLVVRRLLGPAPKTDNDMARRMRSRRLMSVVPTPVIAATMMGFIYFAAMCGVGDAFVSEDSSTSRLAFAAATPKRREALVELEKAYAPRTRQKGVLEARVEVLRMLDDKCDDIVWLYSSYSRHEQAIAQAKKCTATEAVMNTVVDSNLALARFADAAKAIEREIAISGGKRRWDDSDLPTLVLARDWALLERAALAMATEAGGSDAAEALTCVAIAARYRGGNAAALAELRARPLTGGKSLCRLLAADATGAVEDLQALSAFPLDLANHGPTPDASEPTGGDLPGAIGSFIAEPAGKAPYSLAPSAFTEAIQADTRGPAAWRGEKSTDLEELRLLVLATHAPRESRNLMYPDLRSSVAFTVLYQDSNREQLGMRMRAARTLWPHRASGSDTAQALMPMLYTVGQTYAVLGDHARATAYLAEAIALDRSLASSDYDRVKVLERAGIAAVSALVRKGDYKAAKTLLDQLVAMPVLDNERPYISEHVKNYVGAALGEKKGIRENAGLNTESQRPAIEKALAGDGSGLAALADDALSNIRHSLPLLMRYVKDGSVLRQIVRSEPIGWSSSPLDTFGAIGRHLHLAEAARDEETVKTLRARLDAYMEAITAKDTAMLLAAIGTIDAT